MLVLIKVLVSKVLYEFFVCFVFVLCLFCVCFVFVLCLFCFVANDDPCKETTPCIPEAIDR